MPASLFLPAKRLLVHLHQTVIEDALRTAVSDCAAGELVLSSAPGRHSHVLTPTYSQTPAY